MISRMIHLQNSLQKGSGSTSLRTRSDFITPRIRTELTGKSSVRYFGPLIWNTVPLELKQLGTLSDFKKAIRKWKPNCPCRLCKDYIPKLGFATLYQ